MTLRPIFSVSNIRVFGCLRNLMLLCVQFGIVLGLSGQSNFLNVSNQLNIVSDQTGGYLGAGMSVADFNGDGIDD